MKLVLASNELMHGRSDSKYRHPKGFACAWSSKVQLQRLTPTESTYLPSTSGDSGNTNTDQGNDTDSTTTTTQDQNNTSDNHLGGSGETTIQNILKLFF